MENRFHDSKMPLVVGFNYRINDQRIDITTVNSLKQQPVEVVST